MQLPLYPLVRFTSGQRVPVTLMSFLCCYIISITCIHAPCTLAPVLALFILQVLEDFGVEYQYHHHGGQCLFHHYSGGKSYSLSLTQHWLLVDFIVRYQVQGVYITTVSNYVYGYKE